MTERSSDQLLTASPAIAAIAAAGLVAKGPTQSVLTVTMKTDAWQDQVVYVRTQRVSPVVLLEDGAGHAARPELLAELDRVCAEAGSVNWDGDGADPITPDTRREAAALVSSLPAAIPDPEVTATARGWLSLDWHPRRESIFSIRVRSGDRAAYSGRYYGRVMYGTESLNDGVPDTLASQLRRAYVIPDYIVSATSE